MKKLLKPFFSNRLTIVLLFIFGAAMAYATFAENDFGTKAARSLVYDAWWFEVVMVLLSINFVGNIYKYKLWRKGKWSILLFHLAFIITILGAFVTRYFSYEGIMRIREGEASNQIISQERYLDLDVTNGDYEDTYSTKIKGSVLSQPTFSRDFEKLNISIDRFVPNAVQGLHPGDFGDEVLEIVISDGERRDLYLETKSSFKFLGQDLTFNQSRIGGINIESDDSGLYITSPTLLNFMQMATQLAGTVSPNERSELKLNTLYQTETGGGFVITQHHIGKKVEYVTAQDKEMAETAADLLIVKLAVDNQKEEIILAAVDGFYSLPQIKLFENYKVSINYGPKLIETPFSIFLRDFQLERYPGSTSPSSYASEVTVRDGSSSMPYRIFMNNVLDYDGFRFFQASYDMDEKGTVLSVNRDFWGTQITYLGYTLLFLGMMWTLFGKDSRFMFVARKLNGLQTAKKTASMIGLLISSTLFAQDFEIDDKHIIDADHAARFGALLVQDMDGRIKPINSLASEFGRKLYRGSKLKLDTESGEQLTNDQVFLAIHIDPYYWQQVPLIRVDTDKGGPILELVGKNDKLIAFVDLLDEEGNYLLYDEVESANRKKPAERSELDKEVLAVDERFNILFQALDGYYMKIFPKRGDVNHSWFDYRIENQGFEKEDSMFVTNILPMYFQAILEAQETGEWEDANTNLDYITTYQNVIGEEVNPPYGRRKAELLYNNLGINNKLFSTYWFIGIIALILAVIKVFAPTSKVVRIVLIMSIGATALAFSAQTFNLILRWYAGDYPPWSNGYEMIILVSWFLLLFGFIFLKKSDFVLPLSTIFAGTLLFVAFLDWLNPEITNLVPVLKSYWLKIHVAIIVGSYAPLALCALLGVMVLFFNLFPKHKARLNNSVMELTYINELSMTIGLFMLTIGTFLGGVWANESWGRYWGWDPK
ncbi:MAG: cytochrome c biogenesis protein CcsA, partial [Cyclobacteriaceae bacterium]